MRLLPLLLLAMLCTACPGPQTRVIVLGTEPGGSLTATTPQARVVLSAAYTTLAVQPGGRVTPGTTTPELVQQRYGTVLAATPAAGRGWTLYFVPGSTTLTPESQDVLPAILEAIASLAAAEVAITGHTDTVGALEANDRLALARAEAVRALLVEAGLTATFVRVVGRGERAPLMATPDEVDEPENRRVEIVVR